MSGISRLESKYSNGKCLQTSQEQQGGTKHLISGKDEQLRGKVLYEIVITIKCQHSHRKVIKHTRT